MSRDPDFTSLLDEQYAEAAAAWSTFTLSRERYHEAALRCASERASEPVGTVLATLPAVDLFLAAACCDGDEAALAAFHDTHVPPLRAALGKLAMTEATIDEAVQRVLVMVLVGEHGGPQIMRYAARGTLRSWLRTIAVRTGQRLLGLEHESAPGDDGIADLPAAVGDPELELLRARYREQVKRAFAAAFAELSERERNVLRQYHIDGLTIDQLAGLYQVNRTTTARWVAAARLSVVSRTRKKLVDHEGIEASEVDSIIQLVRSQLDVSVREIPN